MAKRGTHLLSFEQRILSAFIKENLSTAELARQLNRSHILNINSDKKSPLQAYKGLKQKLNDRIKR